MARTKYDMTLTEEERDLLTRIVAEGKESDRTILRAHILLLSDWKKNPNTTTRQVAESVGTSCTTVQTVHAEYGKYGLEAALYRKDRLKTRSNDDISGKIVELSEQDPPAGNKRWSNRLLAEEAVKHGIVDKISVATVSKIMRAHNPSPIDRKDIVAEINLRENLNDNIRDDDNEPEKKNQRRLPGEQKTGIGGSESGMG